MLVVKKSFFWAIVLLNLVILISFQNCSDVKFAHNDDDGPGPQCPNPPCLTCNFSNATIQTEPISGYQLNQAIRFIVEDSFYTTITWKFYNDTNDNGNPDPSELIPGTPTDEAPFVTFTQYGTYIAVAELEKDTTPTIAGDSPCNTTLTKFIPIQQNPQCEPVGINGPSVAFVGDVQTFSLAKPPCFSGTVNWDLDRPRSGSGTFVNEFNAISTNLSVTFTYTADHARTNNGEYRVRAGVTRTPDIYEFLKNVDVRFKTCSHAGVEIPGDGPQSIFEAFASSSATCSVGCTSKQFRCDNGLIVPVSHSEPLANFPFATCTPNSGSCTGGACGTVGSFYNRPANTSLCSSGSVTGFLPVTQPAGNPIQSANATWVCDGTTGTDPSCSGVWCHQQQILLNGNCATCPVDATPNSSHTSCDCSPGTTYNPTTNTCVSVPPQNPTFSCSPTDVACGGTLTCQAFSNQTANLKACNELANPNCRNDILTDPLWSRTGSNYSYSFQNTLANNGTAGDKNQRFYVEDNAGRRSAVVGITVRSCVPAPTFNCSPQVVACGQILTCTAHSLDPIELQGCNDSANPICRQRLTVDPGFSHQWVRTPGANPQYTFSFPNNSTTNNSAGESTNLFYVKDSAGRDSNKVGVRIAGCAAVAPQIIFSKTLNGNHEANFNYNDDMLFGRILNASANVRGCTSADIDDPTHGAQSLTACDGDSSLSPWVPLSSVTFTPGSPEWSYSSGVWRYNGRSTITSNNRLFGHQSYLPGTYKSCVQDGAGPRVCVEYTVSANAPTFVISKTANGAEATSFNYLTDSLYARAENLVPIFTVTQGASTSTIQTNAMTKGCTQSPNPSTPIGWCDVDPAFSTRYVKMSNNVEWSCTSGKCDFLGLRLPGGGPFTHALNGPNIWVNGNYKSCIYNQFTNQKTCKTYSITGMP